MAMPMLGLGAPKSQLCKQKASHAHANHPMPLELTHWRLWERKRM
jgi:hypothetical protein